MLLEEVLNVYIYFKYCAKLFKRIFVINKHV